MSKQIQIVKIDNGYIISLPPEQNPVTGQQTEGKAVFAHDKDEVNSVITEKLD